MLAAVLSGCHHNDTDMYKVYPIQEELETQQKVLDWASMTSDERKQYPSQSFVINSYDEFPEEDLMDLDVIKSYDIDFTRNTLLLCYNKIPGIVRGHRYIWRKNLQEGVFELFLNFSVKSWSDDESSDEDDLLTYICTAVLVNKIPEGSEVIFWKSTYLSL